jgi:crotonobetainyl-CoA:carnitine CoA-transferase CaiB-like acyl-CoA transferase
MHATFALLAALHERTTSGRGHFIESTMVETALNITAEMTVEYAANGVVLTRDGNRGPEAAPQGLYPCQGEDQWLALAVVTSDHWRALRELLGDPAWSSDPALDCKAGRRARHDMIDQHLADWTRNRDVGDLVDLLIQARIPAAPVIDPPYVLDNPQLRARQFLETADHATVGRYSVPSLPFRFASRATPWVQQPAPTLGQHNQEVLVDLLGLSEDEYEQLKAHRVIGERPLGV